MMVEAEGSNIVTHWMPLIDSTIENGCLQVIPGCVPLGYISHQRAGGTTVVPELLPETEPVNLECERGDVVLMHRFTPHRSVNNNTNQCRWSLDLRYQTTGHHTGRTGHPAFVVRSESDPSSEMKDVEEWRRLWVSAFETPSGYVGHRPDLV